MMYIGYIPAMYHGIGVRSIFKLEPDAMLIIVKHLSTILYKSSKARSCRSLVLRTAPWVGPWCLLPCTMMLMLRRLVEVVNLPRAASDVDCFVAASCDSHPTVRSDCPTTAQQSSHHAYQIDCGG